MRPTRLYIENFMCYECSYIDFSQFSSALIIGKKENNEIYSNGVGKTTIFKAIEYVLFNQSDVNLEEIIRDDTNSCKVVFDISVNNQEYRISRVRTKKGATDLSLYERTKSIGSDEEVYHIKTNYEDIYSPVTLEKFWKDISGRRTADTEKDLNKLLKINFKSFRSTVHFMQNDFSGLTTSTPEKRKGILKDALNLVIYSKLEKIAKIKSNLLSKEIEKYKILAENINNPDKDLQDLIFKKNDSESMILKKSELIDSCNLRLHSNNDKLNNLISEYNSLELKFSEFLVKEKSCLSEKNKIEISVKEYLTKKTNVIRAANDLIDEIRVLKDYKENNGLHDFSKIDYLLDEINSKKEIAAQHNADLKNNIIKLEELKIPIPDGVCKNCRQTLSAEHKKICQDKINQDIATCQNNILNSKKIISELNELCAKNQKEINNLSLLKKTNEETERLIISKNKEVQEKKNLYEEYVLLFEKFKNELKNKSEEIDQIKIDLDKSSQQEAKNIQALIQKEKDNINLIKLELSSLVKDLTHSTNAKAVIDHTIKQKTQENLKKKEYSKAISDLEEKISAFPSVLQAFSSTGIPNLIIQNVLDDLQIEANLLLDKLKPGLQLEFFTEKTTDDGVEEDTLDIKYFLNNKKRYYEQLSGAQKLSVTFSLKLGLSFLLQKIIGTDIKFLLLDEIDPSLDKASVDSFSDIVKFFQKDFTILVITHNDRLKSKFSCGICVEQDSNMVSRAKVVSSW